MVIEYPWMIDEDEGEKENKLAKPRFLMDEELDL